MTEQPSIPDYLRPWLPTTEDYEAAYATPRHELDGTPAWKHFEALFTSHGYIICYWDETESRRPDPDLAAAVDPFRPSSTEAFVRSVPDRYDWWFSGETAWDTTVRESLQIS